MLEVIKEGLFDQISRYNIDKKERIDKWLKEGINKWLQEGLNEGLKEGKLEIDKNMLKLKIDIIIISKATVLSVEEINKLRD